MGMGSEKKQETLYNQVEGSVFASVIQASRDHVAGELVTKETIDLSTVNLFCEEHAV